MIKELMRDAFDVNASDIHLTVGLPPMFRVNGVLRQAGEEPLRREDTYNMAMELMDDRRRTQFLDNGEADFSYEIENVCRFRVNVFKQSNCVAAALRLISNNIPSFEDLRLPDVISDLAMLPRGLVLVTGPTGSGKSTTLAAVINKNSTNTAKIMSLLWKTRSNISITISTALSTSAKSAVIPKALPMALGQHYVKILTLFW